MAVYTEVNDEALEAFLLEYDIGAAVSLQGIADGVENTNYWLRTNRDSYILTLYEKRVNPGDLPFFLGLMDHLAARGIDCPVPVKGRDGETLRALCGRPAAIVTFLSGIWPRKIELAHCSELGRALAKFHKASASFAMSRPNNLSVEGWKGLVEACAARAGEVAPDLAAEIAKEYDWLSSRWPDDLPAGVIHADLFPDNVFFVANRLSGIIDFYFACTDAYAYELSICLNAWCFQPDGSFNATKARRMIANYRRVRPLQEPELSALPVMARGSALRFLLTRLYDWLNHPKGALVKPKDPLEYLRKLRFHREVTGPGAYGIDP